MSAAIKITANEAEIELLKETLKIPGITYKAYMKIKIILARINGIPIKDIADVERVNLKTITNYVKRYNEGGIDRLIYNKTKPPGKKPISQKIVSSIITSVCTTKPENATHWSTRMLAKEFGISHNTVAEILRKHKLKPHVTESFSFSNDPDFEEKLEDVVGLYLDPPKNAIVISVDEKSQIQALERSQPILPILRNVPERQSHDYFRHGNTTLFAAMRVLTGKVIGKCYDRHRSEEFINFLQLLDTTLPKTKVLHVILDNYGTHKSKKTKEYLEEKGARFVMHYIPTHSSWLNMVERFFGELTQKCIRRGSWKNKEELKRAIMKYIKGWCKDKRKFVWYAQADQIKSKIDWLKDSYGKMNNTEH